MKYHVITTSSIGQCEIRLLDSDNRQFVAIVNHINEEVTP